MAADDVVAGLTLAVMLIPQAMAYAALAGAPPIAGLYVSVVALLAYAWLGTSSHLSVGPVALVALLTASALEPLARGETARYVALAGALAVLVGVLHLLLGLVRAGAIVELISHPVILGFTAAAGLIIGLSQVRDLTGADVERTERFLAAVVVAGHAFAAAHPATLAIGLASIAVLLLGRRVVPKMPMPLVISVAATVVVVVAGLADRGVAVVGEIPAGLPRPTVPLVGLEDLHALLPAAVVIAVISYAESISIAKAIAGRSRERLDTDRELFASGAANVAVGFVAGFPVAGSFTRSAVVHDAGARSQFAGVVGAVVVLLVLVALTPVLEPLLRAVLAAIVLVAVRSLIDVRGARATFRVDRGDGVVVALTFLATLVLGVELGLLTGVLVNLAFHVAHGMRPALIVVGRVPGTRLYRNVDRFPTITAPDGVLLRLDGALDFLSVERVTGQLGRFVAERPEVDWLVLDVAGVTELDATGIHALHELQEHLADAEVALHLATLRGRQRDAIERAGLWDALIEGTCHPDSRLRSWPSASTPVLPCSSRPPASGHHPVCCERSRA